MPDITMQQIADLAGVSRATVSRVLCSPEKVSPATRERILNIIGESGYTYHAGAAELIKRKTSIIGLIIPTVVSTAFSSTVLAVQAAAIELGMSLVLGCSEFSAEKEEALLRQFQARRVAGIILVGHADANEELIVNLQNNGIPSVTIWTSPASPQLCEIGFDNAAAAAKAVRYLVEMGHRRIAMISGPLGGGRRVAERLRGYTETLAESGLEADMRYVRSVEPTIANGEREAMELLGMPSRPTAIFAASDMLAIGTLGAAKKVGLSVPGDVSVAGFDDIEFSAHTDPPLTTVAVPEKEMSRMAAHMIMQLIHGEITPPRSYCLETELIVRQSCAPPRNAKRGASPRRR